MVLCLGRISLYGTCACLRTGGMRGVTDRLGGWAGLVLALARLALPERDTLLDRARGASLCVSGV